MHRGVIALVAAVGLTGCGSGGPSRSAAPVPSASSCPSASTVAGADTGAESSPPGDIPDDQAFVAYSPPDGLYTVKVPEGWARTEGAGGATFTDKLNRIDLGVVDAVAPPTVESVTAGDVPALAAGASVLRAWARCAR